MTLQAIDSIHQVGVYCLALVPANTLPKTPLGGIHLSETKQLFLEGSLHPCNVLMCPHTCVTNLPKPRQKQPGTSGGGAGRGWSWPWGGSHPSSPSQGSSLLIGGIPPSGGWEAESPHPGNRRWPRLGPALLVWVLDRPCWVVSGTESLRVTAASRADADKASVHVLCGPAAGAWKPLRT